MTPTVGTPLGEQTTLDRFIQKLAVLKGPAHDIIILSTSVFNIFRGFRSTGGQNLHRPIDFAGHIYNSAATTAQPVITAFIISPMIAIALRGTDYKITFVLLSVCLSVCLSVRATVAIFV